MLLERSRTAELAQRAHPVREGGPDVQTLAEVAARAFGLRGQDYATAAWDSWRGEDSKWIVQLRWHTGRSDNQAHWAYHPGAQGGTVIPMDEHAHDLLDPNAANRPLRTVRPVTELARQALEAQAPWDHPQRDQAGQDERVFDQDVEESVAEPASARPEPEPEILAAEDIAPRPVAQPARVQQAPAPPARAQPAQPPRAQPVAAQPAQPAQPAPVEPRAAPPKPAGRPAMPPVTKPASKPVAEEPAAEVERPARVEYEERPEATTQPAANQPAAEVEPPAEEAAPPARKPEPAKRGKKNHPIVPSWEDVLLGVRTQRG